MLSQLTKLAQRVMELINPSKRLTIKKVVIGLLYTGIQLQDGTTGVSFTLTDRYADQDGYHQLLQNGFLSKKALIDLIEYCSSNYAILRTIGVAALNTYSQAYIDYSTASNHDVREILNPTPDKIIGMIGNIHPISHNLDKKGIPLKILDKFTPPTSTNSITKVNKVTDLKIVDHLLVSGSALVFDNFDDIISLLPHIPGKKFLVGPSAQIFPDLAFELGFSAVGSSRIIDSDRTMKILQEGGGYKYYKSCTEKYLFLKE